MKSWVLTQPKQLTLVESAPTVLTEDLVKVKIEEVLFSRSDLELYNGEGKNNYPFVLGRNAVGVVSEVFQAENSILQKMDRVVIDPFLPCNNCAECLLGDYDKCANMTEIGLKSDGLLRNFADVAYSQLHHIPDSLSNEKALFVPYVAFCLNIADALNLEKGEHVAIFSSSRTGIILAQLLSYYQAVPIFISDKEELLDLAREQGVFYCFNPNLCDIQKEVLLVSGGRMCHNVVLFANSNFTMKDTYNVCAINANVCIVGHASKDSKLSISQICQKRLNIFCIFNGSGNFASAINLLVTNTVNVDKLIGSYLNFDTFDKQVETLQPQDMLVASKIIKID